MRLRFGGKQLWVAVGAGCSAAAVSLWESGKRVPHPESFDRLRRVFSEAGASSVEIAELERSWRTEWVRHVARS